jgi:transporter family protein
MWIIFAFGSAVFASLTAILAKLGIRNVDSNLATAIRTIVVLFCSCLMVFIVGSFSNISNIDNRTLYSFSCRESLPELHGYVISKRYSLVP